MNVIEGLRALADFLEAHPDLEAKAYVGTTHLVAHNAEDFASFAKRLAGPIGTTTKYATDKHLTVSRAFGPVVIETFAARENVCERVQTGEVEVQREVYPDDVVPTIETVTEPVYEWVCPPSFLALADA